MEKANVPTTAGRLFDRLVTTVALALYVLMILVVGLQILTRWILGSLIGSSLPWTVNLSQMLLVYVTFFGAAVASKKRQHISLDLLVSRFSDGKIRVLTGLRTLLILVFVAVMVSGAYPLYQQNQGFGMGALPAYPPFTEAWLYVPAVVGGICIAIYALRDLWLVAVSPETIIEDIKGEDEYAE